MRSPEMDSVLRVLSPLIPRPGTRLRVVMVSSLLLVAAVFFAHFVDRFYPLREWLFFYYARAWIWSGLFLLASLAAGVRVLDWLVPESLRLGERLVTGMTLGVLVFFWGMFLAGLMGLYHPLFFYLWPAALLLVGGPKLSHAARRAWVHLGRFGVRVLLPRGPTEVLAALLIVLSLAAIYLQVMTPGNIGADPNSYHIPIAEHFVAAGGIRPFADGWYAGNYPHLSSLLFTWAMLAPGKYVDRLILCSHLEWALFLCTLPSVSVLAGRLARGRRLPFAGAAVFLFPGLFLYDSNLNTGADHVLAFWAPGLALVLMRLARRFSPGTAVLAGAFTAAPLLTKYNGVYLSGPAALLIVVLAARARRIVPLVAWGLSALLFSSAFWLKNWIFYGDPFFPLLHAYFPSHPLHEGAAELMSRTFATPEFQLTGTPGEKFIKTLKALVTYSFVPNNWDSFHGDKPVFGSLFTLLLPALFFLRPSRKLWLSVLGVHLGLAIWYVTNHQDRYLQALLPWMAACTAAMLALAWRRGPYVRGGVAMLVALQVVWGSDVYFFRTHGMLGDSPIRAVGELLGSAHQKRYAQRFDRPGSLQEIGDRLPPDAILLVHHVDEKLGARAQTLEDAPGRQGATEYLLLESAQAVEALWRGLGITHVVWLPNWGMGGEDLAREAIFYRAMQQLIETSQDRSAWRLAKLASAPKDAVRMAEPTKIGWLLCRDGLSMGIYTPRGIRTRTPELTLTEAAVSGAPLDSLATANAVVLDRGCTGLGAVSSALRSEFEIMGHPGDREVWVRTRPHGG